MSRLRPIVVRRRRSAEWNLMCRKIRMYEQVHGDLRQHTADVEATPKTVVSAFGSSPASRAARRPVLHILHIAWSPLFRGPRPARCLGTPQLWTSMRRTVKWAFSELMSSGWRSCSLHTLAEDSMRHCMVQSHGMLPPGPAILVSLV
jgi:hypothetical protein